MDKRFNIIYIINTIMTLTKFKINLFLEKKLRFFFSLVHLILL